jgi:hypothetical protein
MAAQPDSYIGHRQSELRKHSRRVKSQAQSLFLNLTFIGSAGLLGEALAGDADHAPADHGLMVGG